MTPADATGARLTAEQLAAIRERAEKATPGPWQLRTYVGDPDDPKEVGISAGPLAESLVTGDGFLPVQADAEFIAAAREEVPALLAHIEAVEADLTHAARLHGVAIDERDAAMAKLAAVEAELAYEKQEHRGKVEVLDLAMVQGGRVVAERDEARAALAAVHDLAAVQGLGSWGEAFDLLAEIDRVATGTPTCGAQNSAGSPCLLATGHDGMHFNRDHMARWNGTAPAGR